VTARGTIAFIWPEGPGFQAAGQSAHQESIRQHFEDCGFDTTVLVPGGKVANPLRRVRTNSATQHHVVTRGEHTIGAWSVVSLRTAVTVLAWGAFRRAPEQVQRRFDRARTFARSRRGIDFVLGSPLAPDDIAWLKSELATLQPLVVAPFTSFCAPPRHALPRSVKADILFLSDHEADRHRSLTDAGLRVAPFDYSEAQMVTAFSPWSAISAIQWDEATSIKTLLPSTTVIITPASRTANPAPPERPGEAPVALFVGSGSMHNVDGLRWFLTDIWPKIRSQRPDAELQVVGTVCGRVDVVGDGVTGLGEVGDLDSVIRKASVLVVPLRTGSGLKVKVVDGLCTGSAIVTTPIGAQGFTSIQPEPFLVCEGADQFAGAVVSLFNDEQRRIDLRKRATAVASMFSPEKAFDELDGYLATRGVAMSDPRRAASEASTANVCIVIPTFRRHEMLGALLGSLRDLEIPANQSVEVLVLDNDPEGSAEAETAASAESHPLTIRYQHVGAGDISKVRNAAIDATQDRYDFVALLDDDEQPEPGWLVELLACQRRWNADAVIGPVFGVLPSTCPQWIADGRYFDVVSGENDALLHEGITGNALLRCAILQSSGQRFDESLGLSGGEDQLFFRRLVQGGAQIRYAAKAVVRETVPEQRCTASYLLRRSVRVGNTLGLIDGWKQRTPSGLALRSLKSGAWMATGAAKSVHDLSRRTSPLPGVLRIARGVGMALGLVHYRYDMYAK
jgi:Glycosyl transferases group 1/Glycosyl transferase family 2